MINYYIPSKKGYNLKSLTSKRRVLSALLGGKVDKVPVTSIGGCGGTVTVDMQEATKIYWPEAHKNSEMMAKLAIASCRLTGIENVRVPFDFVVEPEALGCDIKWGTSSESVPSVTKHPYKSPKDLKMPTKLLEAGRIPIVLDAIRYIRKEVGDLLPISSLVIGPFTLAGELVGTGTFMKWILKNPDYVTKFIEFTTEVAIEFGKAQYRAGSDIVEVADPMASLSLISPTMFRNFAKEPLSRVADNLGGLRVLHICGETGKIISDIVETGFDGISLEGAVSTIKPFVGDVKILGDLSSKKTLIYGSKGDINAEVIQALNSGVDLLEPDCGLPPITPLRNIKVMVKSRDEFYEQK